MPQENQVKSNEIQETVKSNEPLPKISESSWNSIIDFCRYENFSKKHPSIIYKYLMSFINDIDLRCTEYSKSASTDIGSIVSSVTLILQKCRDDFRKFVPLMIKMFSLEKLITDKYQEFSLSKEDFSYYFAADYTVQRILKNVKSWEVCAGHTKAAALVLILWKTFPEFGPIFLGRFFQICPYALPYIPKEDETNIKMEAQEQFFAIYLRFQGTIMCISSMNQIYGIKFCWLWFWNVFKILQNTTYSNQNFCFVLREFLIKVQPSLQDDDVSSFSEMIIKLKSDILPKLEEIDRSKDSLEAYLSDFLKNNHL